MSTINQLCHKKSRRRQKRKLNKVPALSKCPQKRAMCVKFVLRSPKKPNSSIKKIVKVYIRSNNKFVYAYIPGEGHNLQPYSNILLRGGRVQDLPGVKYRLIRGKLDFAGLAERKTSRSKYGTKKIKKFL